MSTVNAPKTLAELKILLQGDIKVKVAGEDFSASLLLSTHQSTVLLGIDGDTT
jgi:hypothetical protein